MVQIFYMLKETIIKIIMLKTLKTADLLVAILSLFCNTYSGHLFYE